MHKTCLLGTLLILFSHLPLASETVSEQTDRCKTNPSNKQADTQTKKTLEYLAALSCDKIAGVLSGQNAGHGDQINDPENSMGYANTFSPLETGFGHLPFVIGLDYEHDKIYTLDELKTANQVLIQHAERGGLVTINWSPLSPWLNDEDDLQNKSGSWQDTRTQTHEKSRAEIDLRKLLDPADPLNKTWLKKLDRIAHALQHLQANNVTVLWRPMQEMNGNWFWWGMSEPMSDASAYIAVWQHMHSYFSEQKKLDNLLWVYSPNKTIKLNLWTKRSALWAFPGANFVDVISPTSYDDNLDIPDYELIQQTGLTLGVAEYGPSLPGKGSLDNALYAQRLLNDYPGIAYWVSWHSYPLSENTFSRLSIADNLNVKDLFENKAILSLPARTR